LRLVLFDIDGTLLDCGRQVRPLFAGALEQVFGTSGDVDGYDFAGKTDPRIVVDLMTAAGVSREAALAGIGRVKALYLESLSAGLDPARVKQLPGVLEVVERLERRSDVAVGLLTGNWAEGARVKLTAGGLGGRFAFGAFGDDGLDRDELPPVALRRARDLHDRGFEPGDSLIIGDSVLDVRCARAHGIPCLAVATSRTPSAALQAAGATWVAPTLLDLPEALRELLG
jgi:phosphoglycolate phosphatase-like HAD superfamily hydrolase